MYFGRLKVDLVETLGGGDWIFEMESWEDLWWIGSRFMVGMWGILMVCGVENSGDLRGVVC